MTSWSRSRREGSAPCSQAQRSCRQRGKEAKMSVAAGGSWLVDPVGSTPQFTGADFTDDDLLYAKTAEDFVRNEVLPRLDAIEAKEEGLMPRLLKRAGELGLLMIDVPEAYGGLGLSKTTSMLVSERGALCASF